MFAKNFLKILILTTTTALLLNQHAAQANPLLAEEQKPQVPNLQDDIVKKSSEELNELNKMTKNLNENSASSSEQLEEDSSSSEELGFAHHDEDLPRTAINLNMEQSLKYDVEVLESRDVQKENIELEERFRGPAIKMNTDTFVAENIEVNGVDDMDSIDDDDVARVQQNHVLLSIILVIVALVSIGLYAALVIWRSHLEQRYGMRELLVTTDDDFHQFSSNCNNNNNNHHFNSGDGNTRHFVLGQA